MQVNQMYSGLQAVTKKIPKKLIKLAILHAIKFAVNGSMILIEQHRKYYKI